MKNQVLPSCQRAVGLAKDVFVDEETLDKVALKFSTEDMKIPDWNIPVYPSGRNLIAIDFFMLGNSINFAYRDFITREDFATYYAGQKWSGAMAMWASLKRALDSGLPILEGAYLKDMSDEQVKSIFSGITPIPLVQARARIFREVGSVLTKQYGGYFHNVVEASDHFLFNNGKGLVERLTQDFPSFDDSASYEGERVMFNKRAQLAAGMLYGRFRNQGEFSVQDIDELTVFADYGLPKTMRHLGILRYSPSLGNKVDSQEIIPSKSAEEIEIRAATICAANSLIESINRYIDIKANSERAVNALHIDYKLWAESRNIKSAHHLTPTTDY